MTISKDQSIIMQVAAKIAADLTHRSDSTTANVVAWAEAYEAVVEVMLNSQGMAVSEAPAPAPVQQTPTQQARDEQALMASFPTATPVSGGFQVRIKGKQHGPLPEWLAEACLAKGVTEVWDNRDGLAANPKRPWFKATNGNDAFWPPRGK
jgi:hypothetical protein